MARVLFLQDGWFEQFGIMMLAAALKRAGHEARVALVRRGAVVEPVRAHRPDLIALSSMTTQFPSMRRAARALKTAGVRAPIVLGGIHPTYCPQVAALPEFDGVCFTEGERTIVDLAHRVDLGAPWDQVPGMCFARDGAVVKNPPYPLVTDLDTLGRPDRTIYDAYPSVREGRAVPVMASRGCPYRCTFCTRPTIGAAAGFGTTPTRYRSVDSLLAEMRDALSRYRLHEFIFQDSILILDRRWSFEFLERYRRTLGLPFSCNVRAELIDEEMATALAAARARVRFGVETGSATLRARMLGKQVSNERLREIAARLHRHGVPFLTYNMFGFPGETVADAEATLRFNASLRPAGTANLVFLPLPGLALVAAPALRFRSGRGVSRADALPEPIRERIVWEGIPAESRARSLLSAPGIRIRENLHKLAGYAIRWPFLQPLARRLARLPPNRFFDLLGTAASWLFSHPVYYGAGWRRRWLLLRAFLKFAPGVPRVPRGTPWRPGGAVGRAAGVATTAGETRTAAAAAER